MSRSLLVIGLVLLAAVVVVSAEPPQAPPPRVLPIEEWVKQLASKDVGTCDEATRRLSDLALDPPPELLAATKSENPDVRERAVNIAQAMRWNVAVTRLPRGQRFAQQDRVDLFVAATAVWDLKPDDSRLWEPAVDMGRRLLERADMKGARKLQKDCPSAYNDCASYLRSISPQFTRLDVLYHRPDRKKQNPPRLNQPEAIQSPGVVDPSSICDSLIISRGNVQTEFGIMYSVVLANGDVTARTVMSNIVIVCDGDVNLTDNHVTASLIVARGNITIKGTAVRSVLMAGGKVKLGEKPSDNGIPEHFTVIKENEPNTLGVVFFELTTVGVEVKVADNAVRVSTVAEGKPFAKAGIRTGDTITEVNGKKPDSAESLRRLLRDALALGDATVTLRRGEKTETVKVSLPE
jgi:hypothetical protein